MDKATISLDKNNFRVGDRITLETLIPWWRKLLNAMLFRRKVKLQAFTVTESTGCSIVVTPKVSG